MHVLEAELSEHQWAPLPVGCRLSLIEEELQRELKREWFRCLDLFRLATPLYGGHSSSQTAFSTVFPRPSSIVIKRECVENIVTLVLPQTYWNRSFGVRPSNLCFNKFSRKFWCIQSLRTTAVTNYCILSFAWSYSPWDTVQSLVVSPQTLFTFVNSPFIILSSS